MMKLKIEIVCVLIQIYSALTLDYKFSPTENCTSSNHDVVKLSDCSNDEKSFNISGEALIGLEKAFVSYKDFMFIYTTTQFTFTQNCPKVRVEIFAWKLGTFVRIFNSDKFEWCALMRGSSKSSRFLKAIVNAVRETSPSLFSKCPYIGARSYRNVSVSKTFLSLIPVGKYKVTATADVIEKGKTTIFFKGGFEIIQ